MFGNLVLIVKTIFVIFWRSKKIMKMFQTEGYICHCLPPDRIWHKVNDLKVNYSRGWGKERSGLNRDSNSSGLCWTLVPLMQCELNEHCRIWTQTWIQVHMPDDSLTWTKRSSTIECWQWHYCLLKGSPSKAASHSASNLSLTLSGGAEPKPSCLVCFRQWIPFFKILF